MKKVLLILVVIVLLSGAGYYFFLFNKNETPEETETIQENVEALSEEIKQVVTREEPLTDPMEYYVVKRKVNVYNQADSKSLVVSTLYKGEKVTALESENGWLRLSDYIVLREGEEPSAEWVEAEGLSDAPLELKEQEKLSIIDGYLKKSDDFVEHQDLFRSKTQQLLDDGTCEPEDFEELGGWVRSFTYKKSNVYFIYCGGLSQSHKIYLNTDTQEIFQR
ncbi:hypothetical protein BS333_18700 [Vibrio azureus]|uniref:SH3b domain-containing protein n=1 Tax=Vibrio azureus NBRC 104587 TaxID=1219077 RepID=U3CHI7_9VIBR|nr:SH3 domain-containing protein [Vibrio azureus]AUI88361.1 hypothetical protein BS333_18700 [Vibrio azureus]GAD77713.1 hypothetical protein VAZ01S_087_00040 [Vibrio azureus NBRC 104587]